MHGDHFRLVTTVRSAVRTRSVGVLMQPEQREHSSGFSFLAAIRIVATQIARRADAAIVDFFHAEFAALRDHIRRKIDFVMRRPDAGAELYDQSRRIGTEAINHLSDTVRDDAKLGALATGMRETNRRRCRIDNVNSAAISDINAESDIALLRDDAVATGKFATAARTICNRDFVSMNLFRPKKRPVGNANRGTDFAMRGIKAI